MTRYVTFSEMQYHHGVTSSVLVTFCILSNYIPLRFMWRTQTGQKTSYPHLQRKKHTAKIFRCNEVVNTLFCSALYRKIQVLQRKISGKIDAQLWYTVVNCGGFRYNGDDITILLSLYRFGANNFFKLPELLLNNNQIAVVTLSYRRKQSLLMQFLR